jgi:hypothetical protein
MDCRRCDRCKAEFKPVRQAQSYCSPRCRREAAYGRERFSAGTKGKRKRLLKPALESRLEASDKAQATTIARSFRNGPFSSIETVPANRPNLSFRSL